MDRNLAVMIPPLVLLASIGCDRTDDLSVDCITEDAQVSIQARAGAVQSDGSVMVYGTVQFGDEDAGAERAVRAVEVAGQEVVPSGGGFNFREWFISVPYDRLVAYAAGGPQARLPVAVYLYGGCIAEPAPADAPLVTLPPPGSVTPTDGGGGDAGGD